MPPSGSSFGNFLDRSDVDVRDKDVPTPHLVIGGQCNRQAVLAIANDDADTPHLASLGVFFTHRANPPFVPTVGITPVDDDNRVSFQRLGHPTMDLSVTTRSPS